MCKIFYIEKLIDIKKISRLLTIFKKKKTVHLISKLRKSDHLFLFNL